MTTITLEEIKEFLRHKPGYKKEGKKRLKRILNNRGYSCTKLKCAQALREVRQEDLIRPVGDNDSEANILFYDIETSYGLAKVWRPGYKLRVSYDDFLVQPKIICISYKYSNSDEIHSLTWDKYQCDKTMLELFINELNNATAICAHNGDRFDLPWIRSRALYHNLSMYPKYTSIDTLKIARRNFNFPSNRLDDIGDYLQLGRKIKTDMSLWDDVINGVKGALEKMVKYCNQDVLLQEKVYNKLSEMILPTVHVGTLKGNTKQTSPYNGSYDIELVKTTTTRAGTIKRLMKDNKTGKYFEMSNSNYKKFKDITNETE